MRTIRLLRNLLLLATFGCLLMACEDKEKDENKNGNTALEQGCISGHITFYNTESVLDAYVQLLSMENEIIYSALINNENGNYTIDNVEPASYRFKVFKMGFIDTVFSEVIQIKSKVSNNGKCRTMDWTVAKTPSQLTVLDVNGNRLDTLDFGAEASVVTRSFSIFNNSPETLEWVIVENCDWITEVSKTSGAIQVGGQQPISVTIDREKLAAGNNIYLLTIMSGKSVMELVVSAFLQERYLPALNALDAEDITMNSAMLNGEILSEGNPAYIERGFVYATSSMPTYETSLTPRPTAAVNENAKYSAKVMGLQFGQTYYVRAYAKSSLGYAYSTNETVFKTNVRIPEVCIMEASDISVNGVILHGNVTDIGDPAYTERGFCYSLSRNPTVDNLKIEAEGSGLIGEFSKAVENLSENKTYYVRAYVRVESGTPIYSQNEISFHTPSSISAEVETMEAYNIGVSSATLNGYISYVGEPPYTERGFCYATTQEPTIYNYTRVAQGSGESGNFSLSIDQLFDKTTYYYRAYVRTNNNEPKYGRQVQFTTQDKSSTANVSLTDYVALYNSLGFWFNPSSNTVKYYWKAYRLEALSGMSDQMIISDVSTTGTEMSPSGHNYDWITDCSYQSTYTVCLVAYDKDGKIGPLTKTNVSTRSLTGQAVVAPNVISCGNKEAMISIRKGENCVSFSYLLLTPFDEFIQEDIPDIFFAMLFHRQDFNRCTENQLGTYTPTESGWTGLIAIGYNSLGEMSSILSKAVFNVYTGAILTNSKTASKTRRRPDMQRLKSDSRISLRRE